MTKETKLVCALLGGVVGLYLIASLFSRVQGWMAWDRKAKAHHEGRALYHQVVEVRDELGVWPESLKEVGDGTGVENWYYVFPGTPADLNEVVVLLSRDTYYTYQRDKRVIVRGDGSTGTVYATDVEDQLVDR